MPHWSWNRPELRRAFLVDLHDFPSGRTMGSVDGACLTATWKELTQPEGAPLARSSHAVAVIGNKVSWRPDRIM